MQFAFVTLFYAQLANVLGAAVVGLVITFFQLFFFFLVDATDVAHHMTGQVAIRVIAKQTRLDFDTWKPKVLCGEFGHFFIGESGPNGQ